MIMMRERGAGWSGAGVGRVSGSGVRVLRAETRLRAPARALLSPRRDGKLQLTRIALRPSWQKVPPLQTCSGFQPAPAHPETRRAGPVRRASSLATPTNELARWQAIGTIHAASFAGTAVVGGHLIEQFGYGSTFYITALINTVGLAALLPVVHLVPTKEKESKHSTEMI